MIHQCPACGASLGHRKLVQAVVIRMDRECPHCKNTIRMNVHPAEEITIVAGFGLVIALAAAAYWLQSQALMLCALGAVMLGSLALPVLERTYLRRWPRYVRPGPPGGETDAGGKPT